MAKENTQIIHVIKEHITYANMIVIVMVSLSLWGISREMGWSYNLGMFFLWFFVLLTISNSYSTLVRIKSDRKIELLGVWSITLWGLIVFIALIMFGHIIKALILIPWVLLRSSLTLIYFFQEVDDD